MAVAKEIRSPIMSEFFLSHKVSICYPANHSKKSNIFFKKSKILRNLSLSQSFNMLPSHSLTLSPYKKFHSKDLVHYKFFFSYLPYILHIYRSVVFTVLKRRRGGGLFLSYFYMYMYNIYYTYTGQCKTEKGV